MITVNSTINVFGQSVPQIIPVVQGDTGRSILFTLADFTIPQGSTATYYVQKPSGEAVYNAATIDGNTVLVELTAQSIIEHGDNYGQVRIENDGEVVTSFDFILLVKPFRGIDATQSTTEMNIFDKAVEQAEEAIDDAKDAALDEINQTTGNFAEAFSASVTYSAGEYVMQSGHLYRFTSNHAAGAWTGSDAEAVTVGEELTDVKDGLDDLKEDLTYVENDGLIVFPTNKIVRGSLSTSDGETVDTSQTSRVSTKQRLSYARDIVVTPDDGYRIYFYTFPQNVKTASGWMKVPYVITAGLDFTFTASKVSEAVVTDIGEMLTHFHVSTQVSDNTNAIENLNDLSVAFSNLGAVYTFDDWIQGGLNSIGWYDNANRICSAKFHKFNAGHIDLKCSTGFAPWCLVYDSSYNYVAGYGNNSNTSLSVKTTNGYYYKFFVYSSSAITPATATGFSCTYKTALTEALEQSPLYYDWHIGNIQEGKTNITATTVANEEEFIYVRQGDVIKSDSSTSYYIKIIPYDNDRAWSNNDGSWVALPYTIASNGYIRIAIRTSDWANITDTILADINAKVSVCKSVFDSLADFNDEINNVYGAHFATNGDWTDDISDLQFEQGNKFTFAIQTDTHFSPKYQGDNSITPLKVLTNSVGFDFIANLGDIIRGYQTDTLPEARTSLTEAIRRYVDGVGCPVLFAVGNHDNNVLWSVTNGTSSLNECILKDELTAKIIKPITARTKIVRNGDTQYYYKDFDEVRVIVLNTRDIAYQEVALGDLDTNAHVISQEQCDWFSNVALDTNKQVLVMCHVPLVDEVSYDHIIPTNASTILAALQSFKTANGTIIGCMYGHTHRQYKSTVNGITHITFADGGYFSEIVMVDTTAKTVKTKLIGNYTFNLATREYTY